jgi:exodeoxyribonuclease VII small subunit
MARQKKEEFQFEQAFKELEAVIARMERGDATLEQSLLDFERGVQLTRLCQQALAAAEQKVTMLVEKNGELVETPFVNGE